MSYKRHYAYFGLSEDADVAKIKNAYRRKAKELHPDITSSSQVDSEDDFKELQRIYMELMTHKKKMLKHNKLDSKPKQSHRAKKSYSHNNGINSLFDLIDTWIFSDLGDLLGNNRGNQERSPIFKGYSKKRPSVIDTTHHNHDPLTVCLECRKRL